MLSPCVDISVDIQGVDISVDMQVVGNVRCPVRHVAAGTRRQARPGVTTAQVAAAAAAWRGEGEDTGTLHCLLPLTHKGKEKRNSRQLAVALWRDAWPRFEWSIFSV